MNKKYDYIIIGAGIVGLTIAYALKKKNPSNDILVIEKEPAIARHASGRNSGVLHAGFYYTADSLKARFTILGNRAMKEYCRSKNIPINECGKLVVAQNEAELEQLYELERRGIKNGSSVRLIESAKAEEIEPNIHTFRKALHSPLTASVDPKEVCRSLQADLQNMQVQFSFNAGYLSRKGNTIQTNQGDFSAEKIINCAGLYADKIAHDFGFGKQYTIVPFKGIYLEYSKNKTDIKTNIYPVPNLKNPFLGVHFTKTSTGKIKIGPTAIPAFWRENYGGVENFKLSELFSIGFHEAKLFLTNSFGFRNLAFDEIKKYNRGHFIQLATSLVKDIDPKGFGQFLAPGIRAQLLHKKTLKLLQDFVVESDGSSVHVLNAVSPAFTCAFPFADFVVKNHIDPS
ncbi:MAG: L-2-hydroxyglutarate oxidase [Candidatus Omnitrophota bacterium]